MTESDSNWTWLSADDPRLGWRNVAEMAPRGKGHRVQRVEERWRKRFPRDAANRAVQSANVRLMFRSDASRIRLQTRNAYLMSDDLPPCSGEVTCDGMPAGRFPMARRHDLLFDHPGGGEWMIHFPWLAAVLFLGLGVPFGTEVEPPHAEPARRWLCYGDSITHGFNASSAGRTWVWLAAQALDLEPINLGFGGAAFGEGALAEYIASRNDWDLLTLAFGINNLIQGHTSADLARDYERFLNIIRAGHPEKPLLCITPVLTRTWDVDGNAAPSGEPVRAFREAVEKVVRNRMRSDENLFLLDGLACLRDVSDLDDHVHPNDAGMRHYAECVVEAWRASGILSEATP